MVRVFLASVSAPSWLGRVPLSTRIHVHLHDVSQRGSLKRGSLYRVCLAERIAEDRWLHDTALNFACPIRKAAGSRVVVYAPEDFPGQ